MKRNAFVLLVVLWLVAALPAWAGAPAAASQVVISFRGGSTWTGPASGTCVWYLPIVGDLGLDSLFDGSPYDMDHAHLVWVSPWTIDVLEGSPLFLARANAGDATIYYRSTPGPFDLNNPGVPVAKFDRKTSLLRSDDGGATDTFIFSAALKWSKTFTLGGKRFNFADLMPYGMTCFEYGDQSEGYPSAIESGTCVAIGGPGGATAKAGTSGAH